MKKLVSLIVFAVAMPIFAESNGIVCRDMRVIADGGYIVKVSKDISRATVFENTIAGPQRLADLTCRRLPAMPPRGADIPVAWLQCTVPNLADAGYEVVVSSGGFAGLTTATLDIITRAGTERLAKLICPR
jgi:hypothetical protein